MRNIFLTLLVVGSAITMSIQTNDRPGDRNPNASIARYFQEAPDSDSDSEEDENGWWLHDLPATSETPLQKIRAAAKNHYDELDSIFSNRRTTKAELIAATESFKSIVTKKDFEIAAGHLLSAAESLDAVEVLMQHGARHDAQALLPNETVWGLHLQFENATILKTMVAHSRFPFCQESIEQVERFAKRHEGWAADANNIIATKGSWWDQSDALAQTINRLQERIAILAPDPQKLLAGLWHALPELAIPMDGLEDSQSEPSAMRNAILSAAREEFGPETTLEDLERDVQEDQTEANQLRTLLAEAQGLAVSATTEIPESFKEQVNQALKTASIIQGLQNLLNQSRSKAQLYRELLQLMAQRNAELAQQSGSSSSEWKSAKQPRKS